MRKLILLGLLIYVYSITNVNAAPVINSVTIEPTTIWFGQDVDITVDCSDNENKTIDNVTTQIDGPTISNPSIILEYITTNYFLSVDASSYLSEIGEYTVDIVCTNNQSQTATTSTTFKVSELTSSINSIDPSPAYIGDQITINHFVYKDGVALGPSDGVLFEVSINGNIKSIQQQYNTVNKYFILKIDTAGTPTNPGIYNLKIVAVYDSNSITEETQLEVKKPIDFEFTDIDKELVRPDDTITLSVKATDRGNKIFIQEEQLEIELNSVDMEIKKITDRGDYFDVEFTAPSLDPGEYEITIQFTYNTFSETEYNDLIYGVVVYGEPFQNGNIGESFELLFKSEDGIQTKIVVNNDGEYNGFLAPGTYDITVLHPRSKLYLYNVTVSEFDDPIKYFHTLDDNIKGLKSAGLFVYGVDLDYVSSVFEMQYNEKNVYDPTEILVYQCNNWNSGLEECIYEWNEIDGEIDTLRKTVTIENTYLSTFVIGNKEGMKIDMNTETLEFISGDLVEISGVVTSTKGNSLPEATVTINKDSVNYGETETDGNGIFAFSFIPTEDEGSFTYTIKAAKEPYDTVTEDINVVIKKKKSISILIPETVRINLGDTVVIRATIVNTGQTEFSPLSVTLSGIGEDFYSLSSTEIPQLLSGEQQIIEITFSAAPDSTLTTHSVLLKVNNEQISKEQLFAVSIVNSTSIVDIEKEPKTTTSPFQIPTGLIVLPTIGNSAYILLFALIVFSAAYILRRKKLNINQREDIKHLFHDLKIEVNRNQNREFRDFKEKKHGKGN